MPENNNISPMRSDFEQIKRQEENGKEYWGRENWANDGKID